MLKKKSSLFLVLIMGMHLISGCSKKQADFNIVELTLDKTAVSLTPGSSLSVNIATGNGEYSAVSSNENIAKAAISGDVITITAAANQEKADAVIVITDKMFKRTSIDVTIAKLFDLTLSEEQAALEVGVPGKDEITIHINSGNSGYKTELLDNSSQFIEVNTDKLESHGKFTVKAIAAGTAKLKVSDAQGKEAIVDFEITAPGGVTIDKSSVTLDAVQGSEVVTVSSGNGDYKVSVANPLVAKAWANGNLITIKGKTNGTTTVNIEDKKGQKATVDLTVNGPEYAMNFSDQYFGYANFTDIAVVDPTIKTLKQVTFEMTCKMDGYRGLQTFMGLEGKLIIRGRNDGFESTHPIQIAGLGDKIMLESTKSFELDKWMNIALVVDCEKTDVKEKYKLYIDGVQDVLKVIRQEETHNSVDLASSSDGNRFEIGRAFGQDFRAMKGTVSEARIWTVARSGQQIKDNMCGLTGQATGLLARWNFTAGTETGYIQDSNGGKYETNLILANAKLNGDYTQVKVPESVFVSKGCPN